MRRQKKVSIDQSARSGLGRQRRAQLERHGWRESAAPLVPRVSCAPRFCYLVVLETVEGNLSQGMRQLNGVYTQYINRGYSRVGHLFQGRYKAVLVEKDSHLLELARYVVLNPVRSSMVSSPGEWPWSSYRAMIALEIPPPWLQTDWLLAQFGTDRSGGIGAYAEFVQAGKGQPSIWLGLRQQIFLGSDAFIKETQEQIKVSDNLAAVPKLQRRPPAKPLVYYATQYPDRDQAMSVAFQAGDFTLKAIGDYFKVHYTTVSRIVNKHSTIVYMGRVVELLCHRKRMQRMRPLDWVWSYWPQYFRLRDRCAQCRHPEVEHTLSRLS